MVREARNDAAAALACLYKYTNAINLLSIDDATINLAPNTPDEQHSVDKIRVLSTLTKGASGNMAALCRDQIYKAAIDLIDTNLIDVYEYVAPESHESLVGIVGEVSGVISLAKHLAKMIDEQDKSDAELYERLLRSYGADDDDDAEDDDGSN